MIRPATAVNADSEQESISELIVKYLNFYFLVLTFGTTVYGLVVGDWI